MLMMTLSSRLTNDATLAELTSLEALLGVMMAKGVVDDAVIAKLWMVYSVYRRSSAEELL